MRTVLIILILLLIMACTSAQRYEKIVIRGSDTMYQLMEILSAVYMKNNPSVSIYVTGGGTEFGFHAIENGLADICMASRNLYSDELKIIADKYQSLGVSYLIAKDALSIYVNMENKIDDISVAQLKGIYLCNIKEWNLIGDDNLTIVPFRRLSTSGTYHYFKSHILDGEEFCDSIATEGTQVDIINQVEINPAAIGFGSVGGHGNTKLLKVEGFEPSQDNIKKDKYPLTRYLQLFTISEPQGIIKNFIDWIMSKEGQKIVRDFGYVSLY